MRGCCRRRLLQVGASRRARLPSGCKQVLSNRCVLSVAFYLSCDRGGILRSTKCCISCSRCSSCNSRSSSHGMLRTNSLAAWPCCSALLMHLPPRAPRSRAAACYLPRVAQRLVRGIALHSLHFLCSTCIENVPFLHSLCDCTCYCWRESVVHGIFPATAATPHLGDTRNDCETAASLSKLPTARPPPDESVHTFHLPRRSGGVVHEDEGPRP